MLRSGNGVFGERFRYPGRKRLEYQLIEAIAARTDAESWFIELCDTEDTNLIAYGLLGLEKIRSPNLQKVGEKFFGRDEEVFFREYTEGHVKLGEYARLMVDGGTWPIASSPP